MRAILITVVLLAVGCEKPTEAPPEQAPPEQAPPELPVCEAVPDCPDGTIEQKAGGPGCTSVGPVCGTTITCCPGPEAATETGVWRAVDVAGDPVRSKQLERAKAAQQELGKTLVVALTGSVKDKGFAESIEFCRGEAPNTTASIGKKHGVVIGRTSHKLRNPANKGPDWIAKAEKTAAKPGRALASNDGKLGVLIPIPTAEVCLNCHGAQDRLADGVAAALAKSYPDDEATGFEAGDRRGWFWIEVPSEAAPN